MSLNDFIWCFLLFILKFIKLLSYDFRKINKGQLLIAEPSISGDLSFNRSVILLADHDEEGSVGFIINKPLKYTINDLLPEINASLKFIMVDL
jgi:putative transcriptional regulator